MIFEGVKAELLVPTITVTNPTGTKSSADEVEDSNATQE